MPHSDLPQALITQIHRLNDRRSKRRLSFIPFAQLTNVFQQHLLHLRVMQRSAHGAKCHMQDACTIRLFGKHVEEAQQEFFQGKALEALTNRRPDALGYMRRIRRLSRTQKHGEGDVLDPLAPAAFFKIGDEHLRHVDLPRYSHDVRRTQKIVGSIVDECLHDARAIPAQDVRTVGYSQGLSEDRRDSEPVGKSADCRCEKSRLQKIPEEPATDHRQDGERADDADRKRERRLILFLQDHIAHRNRQRRSASFAGAESRCGFRSLATASINLMRLS